MNFDRLEDIYSVIVTGISGQLVDFLYFVAYKAYAVSEQEIKRYADNNDLNPNTVRQWKLKFENQGLIKCIQTDAWNFIDVFSPRLFLPFALHLLLHESKRLYEFEKYGLKLRDQHHFLWSMAYRIVDGGQFNWPGTECDGLSSDFPAYD